MKLCIQRYFSIESMYSLDIYEINIINDRQMDLMHNCLRRWKKSTVFISSIFWCILLLFFLSMTKPQHKVSTKKSINLLHHNISACGILKTITSNELASVTSHLENNKVSVNLTTNLFVAVLLYGLRQQLKV